MKLVISTNLKLVTSTNFKIFTPTSLKLVTPTNLKLVIHFFKKNLCTPKFVHCTLYTCYVHIHIMYTFTGYSST